MGQWLLNIWNAQRNARDLCALVSRHEWLVREYSKVCSEEEEKEAERDAVVELAITLSVEYRKAIGNPTEASAIPVCIQEAHALRGRHTQWKFKADKDFGTLFASKAAKQKIRITNQYHAAGLGDWDGWKSK